MLLLDRLWKEDYSVLERGTRRTGEYARISQQQTERLDMLRAELPQNSKQLFEEYQDGEMELASLTEEDAFIQGVRFGVRFILDALSEERKNFCPIEETC